MSRCVVTGVKRGSNPFKKTGFPLFAWLRAFRRHGYVARSETALDSLEMPHRQIQWHGLDRERSLRELLWRYTRRYKKTFTCADIPRINGVCSVRYNASLKSNRYAFGLFGASMHCNRDGRQCWWDFLNVSPTSEEVFGEWYDKKVDSPAWLKKSHDVQTSLILRKQLEIELNFKRKIYGLQTRLLRSQDRCTAKHAGANFVS